jgi:hypothetical protein
MIFVVPTEILLNIH